VLPSGIGQKNSRQLLGLKIMDGTDSSNGWRAWHDFHAQTRDCAQRDALTVAGQTLTYGALDERVTAISNAIAACETPDKKPVAAIYASRSADTYAAILAALSRGYAYVPLNPKFPAERNRYILDRSGASVVVFADDTAGAVDDILAAPSDFDDLPAPAQIHAALATSTTPPPAPIHDNPLAYVLFTSGSTGRPKGVAIRHDNLSAYLDATLAVADYGPDDRLSQNFDLTFDLSVHDVFVTWRAGAHLIVPSEKDLDRPGLYAAEHGVTCWFSVPSLAQKIRMQQDLTPENLKGLRLTLFCGEALPVDLAREWAAATGQRVENWYGPTEATISATRYRLPADIDLISGHNNLVPIGTALPGMATAVDQNGELLLLGPQLADGYLAEPEKTAQAFVTHNAQPAYRTGDRVTLDDDGTIHFVDRIDNQVKIRGFRVELGEIEAFLRDASGGCAAVVVPLPLKSPSPTTLVGVVEGYDKPGKIVRNAITGRLPDYMTPARVLVMPQFPKNASGKVDRGAIGKRVIARLEKMNANQRPKKTKRYDVIIQLVQQINPALARDRIEDAENLMDAGLDSLGFVEFSLLLESKWDLNLTQDSVAEISQMSLWQLVAWLRRELEGDSPDRFQPAKKGTVSGGDLKRTLHYRAMRALDFLDKFPDWMTAQTTPVVPLIGSSGFMRGICPDAISAAAKAANVDCRPCNIGMAMLSVGGIAEFCDFIAKTAKSQNTRFPLTVLELEVMQLSIKPPAGDIEILKDFEAGHFKGIARTRYDADTLWDTDMAGVIAAGPPAAQASQQANWEKKRNLEIRTAFEGGIPMDEKAVQAWRDGLNALCEVSERVAVVIHPIQGLGPDVPRGAVPQNHYQQLLEAALNGADVDFIPETAFTLEDNDFKNISHVNDHSGRQKFSAQLGQMLFQSPLR
jgi:amino acid adenylation domain-containing protein